jgi:putative membrane protein
VIADRDRPLHWTLLATVAAVAVWSFIAPADRPTWWMEALPVLAVAPLLIWTRRRFPLTRLLYVLIALHAVLLLVGAHYTYEHVPLFDWIKERWHLARNHYDRLGHLAQGFVPAVAAREILLRKRVIDPAKRGWLFFLVLCVCMAISACYELVEWLTAVAIGGAADKFLATQGDPFDTQEDMCCALVGAVAALLLLGRFHDRALAALPHSEPRF